MLVRLYFYSPSGEFTLNHFLAAYWLDVVVAQLGLFISNHCGHWALAGPRSYLLFAQIFLTASPLVAA